MDYCNELEKKVDNSKRLSDIDLDYLIDNADLFVKKYLIGKEENQKEIKTHQIRRFFNVVKNIEIIVNHKGKFEDSERVKLLMLRPQLANASGKQKDLKSLTRIISFMLKKIDKIDGEKDFYQFANFFESLVAFHKSYAKE